MAEQNNNTVQQELSEILQIRRDKLKALQDALGRQTPDSASSGDQKTSAQAEDGLHDEIF